MADNLFVEQLVGEPSPPLPAGELTPEAIRWQEAFARWEAEGSDGEQRAIAFEREFYAHHAPVCCQCHHRPTENGYARCRRCRKAKQEYDRRRNQEKAKGANACA